MASGLGLGLLGALAPVAGAQPQGVAPGQIAEFQLPTPGSYPSGITAGADGNLWFTEPGTDRIGRITPNGQVIEFPLPSSAAEPTGISAGEDGDLWFTEPSAGKIGRITPSDQITEFSLPPGAEPQQIAAGPDGDLWFTETEQGQISGSFEGASAEEANGRIGQITPSGQVTEFPLSAPSSREFARPSAISAGPDGDMWFVLSEAKKIGRISSSGQTSFFSVRQEPHGISAGPDGNIWFTELFSGCNNEAELKGSKIGRISAAGHLTEFPLPSALSDPSALTAGPDGNIWFFGSYGLGCRGWHPGSGPSASEIGSINPNGMHHVSEFVTDPFSPEPRAARYMGAITSGPDGNLWYTEPWSDRIGRIAPGPPGRFTIALAAHHTGAHGGWVRLKLRCVGGGSESPCAGVLKVSIGSRGAIVLDHQPFTLASEASQAVLVRLRNRTIVVLAHHPRLRMVATITPSGDEEASDETFLPSLGSGH